MSTLYNEIILENLHEKYIDILSKECPNWEQTTINWHAMHLAREEFNNLL